MASPTCPKCGAALKDDYGMVHCPKCGTMLFIDMDGQANLGMSDDDVAASTPTPAEDPVHAETRSMIAMEPTNFGESVPDLSPPTAAESPFEMDGDFKFATDEPDTEAPAVDLNSAPSADQGFAPEPFGEMEPPPTHDGFGDPPAPIDEHQGHEPQPLAPDAEFSMDSMLGYQEAPADQIGVEGDPLGLNAYANSEVSQAKDGLLSFKILISGIDSKEMRDSLREAIEDARFGWNTSDLMAKISKGTLELDHVAPVKATILINRIKRLPVQIRWEQYAVTQMDGN